MIDSLSIGDLEISSRPLGTAKPPPESLGPRRAHFRRLRLKVGTWGHWTQRLRAHLPVAVRLINCRLEPQHLGQLSLLVELVCEPSELDAVETLLAELLPAGAVVERSRAPGTLLVLSLEPMAPSCRLVRRSGATCLTCPLSTDAQADGLIRWSLVAPDAGTARNAVRLPPDEPGLPTWTVECEAVLPYSESFSLTPRQEMAIRTAFSMGYFDCPRRGTLREISRALAVRPSTAQEHIRRGLAKIVARRQHAGTLASAA